MEKKFSDASYESLIQELFCRFPSFQKVGAGAYKPGIANMEFADQLLDHFGGPAVKEVLPVSWNPILRRLQHEGRTGDALAAFAVTDLQHFLNGQPVRIGHTCPVQYVLQVRVFHREHKKIGVGKTHIAVLAAVDQMPDFRQCRIVVGAIYVYAVNGFFRKHLSFSARHFDDPVPARNV